jgi:hypothetical protein
MANIISWKGRVGNILYFHCRRKRRENLCPFFFFARGTRYISEIKSCNFVFVTICTLPSYFCFAIDLKTIVSIHCYLSISTSIYHFYYHYNFIILIITVIILLI